ncbi:MAG: hypothetical protein JXR48_13225 [Candidatus Delongbacteria bacterium]|nr:hypothetical protein [Candidatus Delongbacteria bacterium]MBN2835916.1 hypothetical protein [Candidatus Delongbacteria bacterium]
MKIVLSLLFLLTSLICSEIFDRISSDLKSGRPLKVFLLHSYEEDHVCGAPQDDGITSVLNEDFRGVIEYKRFYMDTKIKHASIDQIEQRAALAISQINDFNPHILFVLDDNAIKYVAMKLLNNNFYILFSGMNSQIEDCNKITYCIDTISRKPLKNMTGVYEYLHLRKSLDTFKRIFPDKNRFIALVDMTLTGNAVLKQIDMELGETNNAYDFEIWRVADWNQFAESIKKINSMNDVCAVYNVVLSLPNVDGTNSGTAELFKYYINNSNKPAIAVNYAFSRLGLFGGAAIEFEHMGEQTARIALKLLEGSDIENHPVENAEKYMLVFNKKRAEMLKIALSGELEMAADELYEAIPLLDYEK